MSTRPCKPIRVVRVAAERLFEGAHCLRRTAGLAQTNTEFAPDRGLAVVQFQAAAIGPLGIGDGAAREQHIAVVVE
jgi:hypothetical protein